MNKLLGYALTSDEVTPGWGWLMQNTRCEMAIQSKPTAAVRQEAEALLQALASRLNTEPAPAFVSGDIRQALADVMTTQQINVIVIMRDGSGPEGDGVAIHVGGDQMTDQPDYKWTVHCFSDKSKRRHFVHKTGKDGAIAYANELLAKGYRAKIYPYSQPKRYIDIVAERGPNG